MCCCVWPGSCTRSTQMAFQLHSDESVSKGFRRLARKELKIAREAVAKAQPPPDEAIHEARKSVKKVRAILQLVDNDDGTGLDRCRKRLRSVNHTLSELRDAEVMIETLADLRKKHPHLFSEHTYARVHRDLSARKRGAQRSAERGSAWSDVVRQLRRVRRSAKGWRPTHGGADALVRGIQAVHRQGCKAMTRALNRQRADDFHAWRKEIKALWYALRLVEQSDSKLRRDIRALHQAETWLGDEHNIVVLCDQISRDATICRDSIDRDRFQLVADREQCRLREKVVARVRRLYERRSGAYARDVERMWKDWCRQSSRSRARGGRRAAA